MTRKAWILALVLVLVLSLASPALAGRDNFNPDGEYPLFQEKVSLTIGIKQHANVEDFETNWMTGYVEELANVDLSFVTYAAAEMNTQLTLAITAGSELPDILFTEGVGLDLLYQWALAGAVIPLNEYYESDAYYINDAIERTGVDFLPLVTSPDGNVYTAPMFNQSLTNEAPDKIWIYQPWLDALGLEAPTNADELYEVLLAFKTQDPNGNGEADEIALMGSTDADTMSWFRAIMNMFQYAPGGSVYNTFLSDGQVTFSIATDAYREGLQYIRKLFDEGLIDPMTFTADATQLRALINDGDNIVGMTMGAVPLGTAGTERIAEFTGIEPFKAADGTQTTTFHPSLPTVAAMITSNCEDPEAAFRFLDLLYRQDMSIINHWGEEGVHWEWAQEGDVSSYANMGYEASFRELIPLWGTVQNIMWYQQGPWAREYFIASGRVLPDDPYTTGAQAATIQWAYSSSYPGEDVYVARYILTEEETEQIGMILSDIGTYADVARSNFCLNKDGMDIGDDAAWAAYLDQLSAIGIEEAQTVLQTVYDRMYK